MISAAPPAHGRIGRLRLEEFLAEGRSRHASDAHIEAEAPAELRIDASNVQRDYTFTQAIIDEFLDEVFADAPTLKAELATRGKASIGFEVGAAGRLRVHGYRVDGRNMLAIRFVDEVLEPLEDDRVLPKQLRELALRDYGLVLVAGRNGSGKSRLVNRMVDYRRRIRPEQRGLSLDNPLEYVHRIAPRQGRVIQREFGRDFVEWSDGIDGSLEENPDYLVLSQALGSSAMAATTTIANTGLPTTATIHTTDTTRVASRVIDETDPARAPEVRANLFETLTAVIGIILVPTLSGEPGQRRTAVIEILRMTDDVRNQLASSGHFTNALLDIMESRETVGMQTFEQHLAALYTAKMISRETAERYALRRSRLRLPATPPSPQVASR